MRTYPHCYECHKVCDTDEVQTDTDGDGRPWYEERSLCCYAEVYNAEPKAIAEGTVLWNPTPEKTVTITYSVWESGAKLAQGGFDYDGEEAGGLLFEDTDGKYTMYDYEGCYEVPVCLLEALQNAGFDCKDMIAHMT